MESEPDRDGTSDGGESLRGALETLRLVTEVYPPPPGKAHMLQLHDSLTMLVLVVAEANGELPVGFEAEDKPDDVLRRLRSLKRALKALGVRAL